MSLRFTASVIGLTCTFFFAAQDAHAGMLYTNYVWFEATSLNPSSGVLSQGAEGADLELSCDTSAGATMCEWDIAMRMRSTQQFGGMGTNLLGETQKHAISNLTHGGEYPSGGYLFNEINAGGILASLKEVNVPIAPGPVYDPTDGGPGQYLLATMTLHTLKAQGDQTIDSISASINELTWASVNESGIHEPTLVMFGDGPVLDGEVVGGHADCIIIHNTPEPSLALLSLITLGTFSRSRRRQ
ncbi:hypothetical protein B7486_12235 [cyanobacterium TDX16]|nr:hypothetical protein B7486_12235 [cyanobacterium TDX16]